MDLRGDPAQEEERWGWRGRDKHMNATHEIASRDTAQISARNIFAYVAVSSAVLSARQVRPRSVADPSRYTVQVSRTWITADPLVLEWCHGNQSGVLLL